MILIKKRFPAILLVTAFIISGFPAVGLAANLLSASGGADVLLTPVSSPTLVNPAPGTYSYAGAITDISSSSITLYNGVTCIITGSTVCKAPMSGGSMMNMHTVSCSSFTKGETVQIAAAENASGQLVATEISEVFF